MKVPKNVKCDCGELAKDHFQGSGWCSKNGCTWYHPNINWIKRQKLKEQETFDGDKRGF